MQSNVRSQNSISWESNKVWPVISANEICFGGNFEARISQLVFVCSFCSFVKYGMNFAQNSFLPKSSGESNFKTSLTTCQRASDWHCVAHANTIDQWDSLKPSTTRTTSSSWRSGSFFQNGHHASPTIDNACMLREPRDGFHICTTTNKRRTDTSTSGPQ